MLFFILESSFLTEQMGGGYIDFFLEVLYFIVTIPNCPHSGLIQNRLEGGEVTLTFLEKCGFLYRGCFVKQKTLKLFAKKTLKIIISAKLSTKYFFH